MIIVRLAGGLGNQIFQLVAGLLMASKGLRNLKSSMQFFLFPTFHITLHGQLL
jgi:hypothetical protein